MSLLAIRITSKTPQTIESTPSQTAAAFLHLCYAAACQEASYSSEGFVRLAAKVLSGSPVLPR
jgi:hypothetical protein